MFSLRMLQFLLPFLAAASTLVVLATPAIGRPNTYRGIIFPKDSYDDCFMDEARQRPGTCRLMEHCEPAIRRWEESQETPKTCYFIKFNHYVCCDLEGNVTKTTTTTTTTTTTRAPSKLPLTLRRSLSACYGYYNIKISNEDEEEDKPFVATAVGGKPTAFREFPYMSALGWRSNFDESIYYRCGGTLIAPNFVLTAAHCIDFGGEEPAQVRLGGDNLTISQGEDYKIKRVIIHPDYDASTGYNDIALLELDMASVVRPHRLKPACLWSKPDLITTDLTAIGYGQTRFAGLASAQLLKVYLQFVHNQQCQLSYPPDVLQNGVIDSQICAGDSTRQQDTCQGDSGGPLLMRENQLMYVVGITSLGQGCASGPPSIYSRVSSYLDWIEDIVWPINDQQKTTTPTPFDVRVDI